LGSYGQILHKLQTFVNRYYKRQLIKGVFLFLFLGGLLLLFVGALEYFLWLNSGTRTLLLWLGIFLEGFLLIRYVAMPILYLFRLRKGLSYKEGSRIIGRHFSDVSDKLYNLLELAENEEKSELLLASIEQRSQDLMRIPFQRAINMKDGYRYARYAGIPLLVMLLIWLSGRGVDFYKSYERVVRYDMAFEPPAPFHFQLLTSDLRQREDKPFVLKLATFGEEQPGQVKLVLDGSPLIMENQGTHFEYTFQPPLKPARFSFEAAGVTSRTFELEVLRIPIIDQFEMEFRYPAYLDRPTEQIRGSGNAILPEGTTVSWKLSTIHADSLQYRDQDTLLRAPTSQEEVSFEKKIWKNTDYAISASNADIGEYDKLRYRIEVVPDEYPEIRVTMEQDSLEPNLTYFAGNLTDDHGLSSLKAITYAPGEDSEKQIIDLPLPKTTYHSFYYTYPSGFQVVEGKEYILYFEVRDNDGNRNGKIRKSAEFRLNVLNEDELTDQRLEYQEGLLKGLQKTTREQEQLDETFEELERLRKEKEALNFEDKQKLKEFLKRQENQEKLMEKFSRELAESLEETPSDEETALLKERLERQEAEAKKNAALMEEIQKILDKLDQEAFEERMEEVTKSQKGSQRNMQQLLELTKRYYVQQKSRQLARELSKLAEQQELFPENRLEGEFNTEQQEKLNEQFQELRKALADLEEDNNALRKPLSWERDIQKEDAIQKDQKEALEQMNQQEGDAQASDTGKMEKDERVSEKQRNAARKLRELSEQLDQGASGGGAESIAEDAEMLRQILDNLVTFSMEQERLFSKVQNMDESAANHSTDIRKQKELRALFEHVDDSLFALSLRRAEISEVINTQITEVYYNIDKGLESMGNNNWYRGASYQQYVITATNELSSFLAELLDNMQQSLMPGQGQGGGGDFQLPDIIQSQEELRKRAMQGQGKGNEQGSQEGNQKGNEPGKEGAQGTEGAQEGEGSTEGNGEDKQGKGTEPGQRQGQEGRNGPGDGEESYAEFFEIYKEQQKIRQELEKQLEDMLNDGDRKLGEKIAREMEVFEEELLRNGITERTADRLNRIQQQLMRLENAALEQGERKERESTTNKTRFTNPILTRPEVFERTGDEIEFLNREALPLRRIYREKVKLYFNKSDNVPLPDGL